MAKNFNVIPEIEDYRHFNGRIKKKEKNMMMYRYSTKFLMVPICQIKLNFAVGKVDKEQLNRKKVRNLSDDCMFWGNFANFIIE